MSSNQYPVQSQIVAMRCPAPLLRESAGSPEKVKVLMVLYADIDN